MSNSTNNYNEFQDEEQTTSLISKQQQQQGDNNVPTTETGEVGESSGPICKACFHVAHCNEVCEVLDSNGWDRCQRCSRECHKDLPIGTSCESCSCSGCKSDLNCACETCQCQVCRQRRRPALLAKGIGSACFTVCCSLLLAFVLVVIIVSVFVLRPLSSMGFIIVCIVFAIMGITAVIGIFTSCVFATVNFNKIINVQKDVNEKARYKELW